MAILCPIPSVSKDPNPSLLLPKPSLIFGPKADSRKIENTHFKLSASLKNNQNSKMLVSWEPQGLIKELKSGNSESALVTDHSADVFEELKQRFLSFKKHKYMQNIRHYKNLAKGQAPKFMVIACADSRVCPSNILGFQPGEAFVVRNVANMVPSYESGPSETNAALEFAVNSLKVENILVIGHRQCGGIRALMSMHDDVETSSFIGNWVSVGMNARLRTKAAASNLSFDHQCRHCEKESVNCSLANLLTYPWIYEKVRLGELFIHGGYYDFIDCTFEKWTLDCKERNGEEKGWIALKDRSYWR